MLHFIGLENYIMTKYCFTHNHFALSYKGRNNNIKITLSKPLKMLLLKILCIFCITCLINNAPPLRKLCIKYMAKYFEVILLACLYVWTLFELEANKFSSDVTTMFQSMWLEHTILVRTMETRGRTELF